MNNFDLENSFRDLFDTIFLSCFFFNPSQIILGIKIVLINSCDHFRTGMRVSDLGCLAAAQQCKSIDFDSGINSREELIIAYGLAAPARMCNPGHNN